MTTKAGNYYYILIDRANEDKETSVHFLNQVDDADLLALLDEEPQAAEFCICTVKCEAGNVNERALQTCARIRIMMLCINRPSAVQRRIGWWASMQRGCFRCCITKP